MVNIYLIGFMGAGKSTIGPLLAQKLGYKFVDSDSLIEEEVGMSIPEIFKQRGEEHFRELESEIIRKLSRFKDLVVALGGGALMKKENRARIESGHTIYLQASPEVILERTRGDNRPLLAGLDDQMRLKKIKKMLKKRRRYYLRADFIVDNGKKTKEEVLKEIKQKVDDHEEIKS